MLVWLPGFGGVASDVLTSIRRTAMLNPLRFQSAEERLVAARNAIGQLSSVLLDPSMRLSLQRTAGDLADAGRLFEDAHLLFIKLENLLTIVEWQIERLSSSARPASG